MAKSRYPNVHRSISKGILDQLHIQLCWLLAEETIYSQRSGKWPRQDKFQFSQLEIGGHQKCKREQQFEPDKVSTTWRGSPFLLQSGYNPFVRSFAAESARDHLTDFSRGARTSSGKGYSYMPLKVHFNACYLK